MPKVSVVMPVYNTETFVREAIESILNQTFKDFEFIIIDDCSTDRSWDIIEEYSKTDARIIIWRNEKNMGISYTRNKLIELATTNYIASQDSDDISKLYRLEKEYLFLINHSRYWVVSGNNIIIDEEWRVIGYRKYSDNIQNIILKKSPISQPSSMFRKDAFLKIGWYDKNLNYAEDYDLWLRMYLHGYKIKNISEYLIKLRIRAGQTKSSKLKETLKNTISIQKKAIKQLWNVAISNRIYILFEQILLILPSSLVMHLFKMLEYKNAK